MLITLAMTSATQRSLSIVRGMRFRSSVPRARSCTTMVEDCIPTLPPVPPMRGMKREICGIIAKTLS